VNLAQTFRRWWYRNHFRFGVACRHEGSTSTVSFYSGRWRTINSALKRVNP
jgi:hypothetical protein